MISPAQMKLGVHYKEYSREEIEQYLEKVLKTISEDNFVVTKRKNGIGKNEAFKTRYNLKHKQIKSMLESLVVTDFCYTQLDDHNLIEVLYVFAIEKELWDTENDQNKQVQIYIKTCYKEDSCSTVVISFHEAEYAVEYRFKS